MELVLRLRNLARGLSQISEYCGVCLLPCGDLAARRRSRRSPHLDLVEDSTQGWQWFCLSSRFDSCAAFLSLLSKYELCLCGCPSHNICGCPSHNILSLIERTSRLLPGYICPLHLFIYTHASCYQQRHQISSYCVCEPRPHLTYLYL